MSIYDALQQQLDMLEWQTTPAVRKQFVADVFKDMCDAEIDAVAKQFVRHWKTDPETKGKTMGVAAAREIIGAVALLLACREEA